MNFSEPLCLGKPKFITRGLANSPEMELITRISISMTFLIQDLTNIFPVTLILYILKIAWANPQSFTHIEQLTK